MLMVFPYLMSSIVRMAMAVIVVPKPTLLFTCRDMKVHWADH